MICRLCLNALDEQSAVLLFGGSAGGASASAPEDEDDGKAMPESYLVQLISIHLYLCVSGDPPTLRLPIPPLLMPIPSSSPATMPSPPAFAPSAARNWRAFTTSGSWWS